MIAKNESDGNNSLVFVDLLLSILSREQKFHRTPTSFAFVHAIPTLESKDLSHIVEVSTLYRFVLRTLLVFQTAMMSEAELAGNGDEDMEDEEGMPFDESDIPNRNENDEEDSDSDSDEEEEEDDDEENEVIGMEISIFNNISCFLFFRQLIRSSSTN